ncbi:MAG: glycosyltransferase family 39 protein [Anaerolineae bacterium]|nr:glycosyltransferase family 39 protein [Anaerolineae bacterium]
MRKSRDLLGIVMLAFVLRLWNLGSKSLWIDEADSIYFAQHLWGDLLYRLCDPHPPGYYALLKSFIGAAGSSELVARLPAALAGGLSVAVAARLGYEITRLFPLTRKSHRWIWLSSALLAVAPLHIWYSQEARMYALVTLLGLSAAVFAVRLLRRWQWSDGFGYLITASLGLLTDQTAFPVLLGLNVLWLAIQYRRRSRTLGFWLAMQVMVGLAFWLWWRRALYIAQISSGTLYPLTMLKTTLMGWEETLGRGMLLTMLVVASGAGALLAVLVWSRLKNLLHKPGTVELDPLLAWMLVSVYLGGAIASVIPRLYTLKRLLVILLPYALLLVAWGVLRLTKRRWVWKVILGFSMMLSLANIWLVPKAPWREAISIVEAQIGPNDSIWVDELAVPAFDYYAQEHRERRVLRITSLDAIGASLAQSEKTWLIVQTGRYRDLFDYYPSLSDYDTSWSNIWAGIEVRAYDATQTPAQAFAPAQHIPEQILTWPSPLDEACADR